MSNQTTHGSCPDCDNLSRRDFIRTAAAGVVAVSAGSMLRGQDVATVRGQDPAMQARPRSETLVTELHKTLTPQQKRLVAFPFDHPLRQRVENNWRITRARVDGSFTPDQQAMIREIFLKLHSEEYAEKVLGQVEQDNGSRQGNGFGRCSIAMFGEPGTGKFEFVFTGRHVTRRCDGDSVEGAAFGGPIFYGHAAQGFNEKPHHPGNAYWFQAVRANEVFQALDGKQRGLALRSDPKPERSTATVKLTGKKTGLPGIPMTELSDDQKKLVRKTMADLLAPFRKVDTEECMKLIEAGGFDNLHMAFYKNMDIGNDGVWDVWQIEGPAMVWYFRGSPHVHTWVHIRKPVERKRRKL